MAKYRIDCNLSLENTPFSSKNTCSIVITKQQENSWLCQAILLISAKKEVFILAENGKWENFLDLTDEKNIFPLSWELQNFVDAILEAIKYQEYWTILSEIQIASTQIFLEA